MKNIFKLIFKIIKIIVIIVLVLFLLLILLWQFDIRFNLLKPLKRPDLFELIKSTNNPEFPQDEQSCLSQNGLWKKIGISPREECNLPTLDEGKVCNDSSECEAYCLANLTREELTEGMKGKIIKTTGTCSAWYKVLGCRAFVKKGKAYTVCID